MSLPEKITPKQRGRQDNVDLTWQPLFSLLEKEVLSFAAQHCHYKLDDYPQLWALKDILMVFSASTTSNTYPIIHSLQLNQQSTTIYETSMGDQPISLKAFTSSTNETVYSGNSVLGRGGYNGPQKHPNMFVLANLFKVII